MAAASKTIVLVTGGMSREARSKSRPHQAKIAIASGGIGLETVKQLIADTTKHVILGSRSVEKGEKALKELQSENPKGSVELLQLDVNSYDSVMEAAKKVTTTHGRLDTIVNNAAIATFEDSVPVHERLRLAYQTNCIGPVMVVAAFRPLLKKSVTTPRIVNVSSGIGSITKRSNPNGMLVNQVLTWYSSSKAALNMITTEQALELGHEGVKVFSYCPGFTVSNLSAMNTSEMGAKPTSEGVKPLVDIINGKRDDENAGFLHADGQYPW